MYTTRHQYPTLIILMLVLAMVLTSRASPPLDRVIRIQPIQVCSDDGAVCSNSNRTLFVAETAKIWTQAGIIIEFLEWTNFNSSAWLNVSSGLFATNAVRLLAQTLGHGQNSDPHVINVWFVNTIDNGAAYGYSQQVAERGELNGVSIADITFSYNGGIGRLDTIAHELGHNLGLNHTTFGAGSATNLMSTSRQVPTSIADIVTVDTMCGTVTNGSLDYLTCEQVNQARSVSFAQLISVDIDVLGTNGEVIANGEAASVDKGTDFGSMTIGLSMTNRLAITNAGTGTLTINSITTNGAGAAQFRVLELPSVVQPGTVSNFSLIFQPTISGVHTAAVEIVNNSTSTPYGLYLVGIGLKRDQTILFPAIGDQFTTNRVILTAGGGSTNPVIFAVASGAGVLNGTTLTFTNAGSVSIVASQSGDTNWNAALNVTNTFTVTKAFAAVTLTNLTQTYNGLARVVGATTVPAGLTVDIRYGGGGAPINAGSYAVTGTVNDVMYQGSRIGMLVVAQANQTITFPPIGNQITTNRLGLSATASSGLSVTFATNGGPARLTAGTNLTFTGTGEVTILAIQWGNTNWNAATTSQTFYVSAVTYTITPSTGIHGSIVASHAGHLGWRVIALVSWFARIQAITSPR